MCKGGKKHDCTYIYIYRYVVYQMMHLGCETEATEASNVAT